MTPTRVPVHVKSPAMQHLGSVPSQEVRSEPPEVALARVVRRVHYDETSGFNGKGEMYVPS